MANLYGKPQGFLEDYSGIAALGAGFEGALKGLQAADEQKYKRMEFESKMKSEREKSAREAEELAIKRKKESPEYLRRQEDLDLAKTGQEAIRDEEGNFKGAKYRPDYFEAIEKKAIASAAADPLGTKAQANINQKLEAEKKRADIAKDKKQAERSTKSPVAGYNKVDDYEIDPTSARQLKEASAELGKFNNQMTELETAVKNASPKDLANPYSNVSKDIKNRLRDLQLTYKGEAFAKLGVLTGPDMAILEDVIENPGSVSNLFSGKSGVLQRYKSVKERVGQNFNSKAQAFGLVPAGMVKDGIVPGGAAPAPATDLLAKQKRLQELEAKARGQ